MAFALMSLPRRKKIIKEKGSDSASGKANAEGDHVAWKAIICALLLLSSNKGCDSCPLSLLCLILVCLHLSLILSLLRMWVLRYMILCIYVLLGRHNMKPTGGETNREIIVHQWQGLYMNKSKKDRSMRVPNEGWCTKTFIEERHNHNHNHNHNDTDPDWIKKRLVQISCKMYKQTHIHHSSHLYLKDEHT